MTEVGKETENEELFPEAVFGEKDYLSEVFGLEQHDIRMYSPLTLAYIGDAGAESKYAGQQAAPPCGRACKGGETVGDD